MTANDHMAPIQPSSVIIVCSSGAKTNCPKEPPALITPAAVPRCATGTRPETAPISTEKLAAPVPTAESNPMVNTSPGPEVNKGVSALPNAKINTPATSTGVAP